MTRSIEEINKYPLWTAIVTPMNEDGSVDFQSFEKNLREQEKAAVAVVILGSTGEALNLTRSECKQVLEFGLSLKLKVPVMTGIGGFGQKETLEYVEYLNSLDGLDAYLVVTPIYAKPGNEGQYQWFKKILDTAQRPCMLYNVPGRAGVKMSFEAVSRLDGHPKFWAVKEASGSVADFKNYKEKAPRARFYSGDDGMVFDFAPFGVVGLVSVASNPWPSETKAYVERAVAGKLTPSEVELWKKASDSLFIAANPVPVKNLMHALLKIKTPTLKAPLSHLDLKDQTPLIAANENVTHWFKKLN